ncbi:hypothetical protein WMY93_009941 [Mugilogobius chulae]|uniref:Uncharacterized protein n=1 Tax=Mugilogobius chulae TaxID=88201 RepID=A0AAW0P9N7_9GOBI
MMPFLSQDLTELMKTLLRRFVKREVLQGISPLQLTKTDLTDPNNRLPLPNIDIGLGAESVINKVSELTVLEFKRDCMKGLSDLIKKVQEKSPLKYATVRQMECLDPTAMFKEPDRCKMQMKSLIQTFLQCRQLTGICAGDVIFQQYEERELWSAEEKILSSLTHQISVWTPFCLVFWGSTMSFDHSYRPSFFCHTDKLLLSEVFQ